MRKRREASLAGRDRPEEAAKDPSFVTALARGLDILRAFRRGDTALGNQELAERTGLPKPTVSRLTYTLTAFGYLVYVADSGRYRLGTGVLSLGYNCLASMGIRQIASPPMQELADYTGASVALGARDRLSMVYLECRRGNNALRLDLDVGSHLKLATSAIGRAHIVGLEEGERARLMADLMVHEGAAWPRARAGIERALEDYRRHGFCLSLGEWRPEINAVGVPLGFRDGGEVMALNCGGPAFALTQKKLIKDIGPRLIGVARDIAAGLVSR